MARRMADKKYHEEQWEHRYDEHIAPINHLVDELRQDSHIESAWAPYVAPMYGGVNARLLSLLRDPGPKTQQGSGSGFLSMENDDSTAETISKASEINYWGRQASSERHLLSRIPSQWFCESGATPRFGA